MSYSCIRKLLELCKVLCILNSVHIFVFFMFLYTVPLLDLAPTLVHRPPESLQEEYWWQRRERPRQGKTCPSHIEDEIRRSRSHQPTWRISSRSLRLSGALVVLQGSKVHAGMGKLCLRRVSIIILLRSELDQGTENCGTVFDKLEDFLVQSLIFCPCGVNTFR